MGSSASSSKQIINKNADAHTKHDNLDQLVFKENADTPNYNEKQNTTSSSTATTFASVSEPLHMKSTSHLSCPLFLHAMPNMTVIPYNILPSSNSDGLIEPSSITTAATILFPMLDNAYSHMGACGNVTFDSAKCLTKESKMTVNNKINNINNNNSGDTASISLILANEIANTHYQMSNLSDISSLLGLINGNKFAQKYGVCYLINYSVGDDGRVVGVQNVNSVGKKSQAAVKCGRGFNLHNNANTSCTNGKDFSDIASVSSSCNFSLREPSVLSVVSDKLDLETEADMCSRSFTSTVKVLDEASVVEHEDHEPIISIPPDLIVKSVLVQESTIKDKEPLSSHTLLRRRSSRMLKKKEREQTLASSHTHCRTRYCVFNDSVEYEAHITIGLLNNIGTLSVENDEVNKASGLRVLCKPTVHVNDPLIRPGQSKKVGYNHNVICSDHSVWCYIEVNSHSGKKNDEINSSDKSTKSTVREKKSKVCISEVNTVSDSNTKVNNNEDNNNKNKNKKNKNDNNNHCAVKNGHSEFYSWKDALLGHATSTEINTFNTYLNELEHNIDCNVQRNWNEIYIVLAPGASVMVFEGVVNAFFMHVQQVPFNEKVSLAKWGKYYTEEEVKAKKSDIQTLFAKERSKPKEKRKNKINAHTLLYALSISPENTHTTSANSYSTHTPEPVNVDATNIKANESASEAKVTNDLRLNLHNDMSLKEEQHPADCIRCNNKSENINNKNINYNNREYANIDTNHIRKADLDEDVVEVFVTPESNVCGNTHDKDIKGRELSNNCTDNAQFRQLSKQENKEFKLDNNYCNSTNKNGYYNKKNNCESSESDAEEMSSGRSNHYLTTAKKKSFKPMKMLDNSIPLSESEGNTCKMKNESLFQQEIQFQEYSPYAQEQVQQEKIGEQIHAEDYNAEQPLNCKVVSPISFNEAYDGSSIVFESRY